MFEIILWFMLVGLLGGAIIGYVAGGAAWALVGAVSGGLIMGGVMVLLVLSDARLGRW